MYQRCLLFVTLAGALTLAKSDAAEQVWLRAATPNFELYTTENEGAARRAILNFEQVRAFFLKSGTAMRLPAGPVRVIGFRSEREFRPYSPRAGIAAYYQPSQFRECIVMQDLSDVVFPIAVHEYVHLLLHHAGAKTPPWLGEGLAEFYSTLRRGDGQSIRVGEVPLGRRASLQRFRWLELDQLFRADLGWLQSAPREQLDVFYGESWALVHMLSLSEKYQAKFPPAMDAILAGGDSETAILKALGVSLDQLRADLQAYMSRQVYRVALFPFSLEKEVEQLDVRPATSLEAAVAVAEFLAERKDKQAEARQAY